jgi:hypothetical protein
MISLIGRFAFRTSEGIGRHAVDQVGFGKFADFGDVGGVDEELHGTLLKPAGRASAARRSGNL